MCRCAINPSQLIEVPPEQAAAEDDEAEADAHPGRAPGKAQRARLLQSAKLLALLGHRKAAAAGEAFMRMCQGVAAKVQAAIYSQGCSSKH